MKNYSNCFVVFTILVMFLLLASQGILAAGLTINVGSVIAEAGDAVIIPVSFEDIPTVGINNCDFRIGFDNTVLEAVSVSVGGIVPRPTLDFYSYINNDGEYVSFLFADEEQQGNNLIYDDGVFANIEFKVLTDAPSGLTEITVSNVGAFADYDLNTMEVETIAGGITVEGGVVIEVPEAPILNSAVADDGNVTLDWSSVSDANGYEVKYGTSSGSYSQQIDVENTTSYTVSGLTNGTTYYFVVTAYNSAGSSDNSNQLSATPESDEPTDIGQIELELSQNTTTTTNTINPTYTLSNIGTSSISLSDVKIRYYYTIDGGQTQNFWCDNGAIVSPSYSNITSSVEGTFTEMSSSTSDVDYYLEIGFSGNTLAAGATAEIQTRFVKDDWSNYDQSNDFSFNNAENVTVYINGQLVWGNVPEGGTIEVPAAPELNSVEAGVGSVNLDWNSVTDADGYIIKYGTVSANYTQEIDVASSTAYTVSNLLNTTYYFVVVAYNEAGNSDNSNELSATPQDDNESTEFTIDIEIATASPGDTVTIPIKLINVPSAGINNCDFRVGFDSNVLEVVDVSTGDIIPRPALDFYSYINTEEEYVSFLFADEEQQGNNLIYDDGVFTNIEFRVLAGAPAGLTKITVSSVGAFADYDLNVFEVETETGGITVSN
ncbi:hypothetical protein GM661_03750 [Iocasia frigidifontis]|uniref:Uncharacterized protein n=1 Tax=Iocasia fonsfrigidae TaxID=2682810 RepID=A0A8A7K6X8_9FIRM|nr:cohesin domain-containing protein [Iocasia fonsfrigidae]QTL97151.1 hypothetical protein GM661_03750 [Iocasia fonsfrigidae]